MVLHGFGSLLAGLNPIYDQILKIIKIVKIVENCPPRTPSRSADLAEIYVAGAPITYEDGTNILKFQLPPGDDGNQGIFL